MRRLLAFAMAGAIAATPVIAQDRGPPRPVADSGGGGFSGRHAKSRFTPAQSAAFAKQIERNLAEEKARVAIVFRTGRPRDKLPKGISYTHGAIWIYGDIKGADGRLYKGYAVYNLYQGDGKALPVERSYLAQDFPVDFVAGSQEDDVAVIIPSPEMQRRLMTVVASPQYERLHSPDYSLVSNPFDAKHQNCTEFVLDVVAAAAWETTDYSQIKANLRAHFNPTVVQAGLLQRVFGPLVDPRLKLDDQDGAIVTATYESIAGFMEKNGLLKANYVLQRES